MDELLNKIIKQQNKLIEDKVKRTLEHVGFKDEFNPENVKKFTDEHNIIVVQHRIAGKTVYKILRNDDAIGGFYINIDWDNATVELIDEM